MSHSKTLIGGLAIAVSLATTSLLAPSADAATIAVNFGDSDRLLTQPSAFGVGLADWTQSSLGSADSTVTVDGVNISWTSSNLFGIGGSPVTGEDEIYRGYLDDGGSGAFISISGLSNWLTTLGDVSYTITVIMASADNATNGFAEPSLLDPSSNVLEQFDVSASVSYNGEPSSAVGTGTSAAYSFDTVFVDGLPRNGAGASTRGSIAGVLITSQPVPEPLTLLGASAAVAFGAAFKRRKA